ncbi:hypothetical protein BJY52DRAFT_1283651 [Lactarius psammicola]|nr:hypothetical protein BJY52DRAFT_1283651 [Lactarius psammicola]
MYLPHSVPHTYPSHLNLRPPLASFTLSRFTSCVPFGSPFEQLPSERPTRVVYTKWAIPTQYETVANVFNHRALQYQEGGHYPRHSFCLIDFVGRSMSRQYNLVGRDLLSYYGLRGSGPLCCKRLHCSTAYWGLIVWCIQAVVRLPSGTCQKPYVLDLTSRNAA